MQPTHVVGANAAGWQARLVGLGFRAAHQIGPRGTIAVLVPVVLTVYLVNQRKFLLQEL